VAEINAVLWLLVATALSTVVDTPTYLHQTFAGEGTVVFLLGVAPTMMSHRAFEGSGGREGQDGGPTPATACC